MVWMELTDKVSIMCIINIVKAKQGENISMHLDFCLPEKKTKCDQKIVRKFVKFCHFHRPGSFLEFGECQKFRHSTKTITSNDTPCRLSSATYSIHPQLPTITGGRSFILYLRKRHAVVQSWWNMMAQGDAREVKWKGNWRMEWVASTLHTTSEHGVSSITQADAHTSAASSQPNWHLANLNGLVLFAKRRNLFSARVPSHFKRSLTWSTFHE